jgi:hydrogenase small subunit
MENHSESSLAETISQGGVSRRDFLKFCTFMTGTLALPASMIPRVVNALETAKRPPVVWLEYSDCAGCTESLLRAYNPTVAQLVLETLSLDYHETIMAPSGHQAEKSLADAVAAGGYLTVVEGAIPVKDDGIYCCVGGRTALDILQEVAANTAAIITVGACSFYGGWPATTPNPTEAKGVKDVISGVPIINLPGCPMNVDNLTATIVHYLTFNSLPALDDLGRPLFAYGRRIHDNCERRGHFDAGEFVQEWGDEGHQKGWCLYQMGCKGPIAYHNCPTQRWNEGTNWPVGAGHGCIACAAPDFWEMPAYQTVPVEGKTPPTTYPAVEEAGDGSALATVGVGVAAGAVVGAVGAIAVQQATKAKEE